MRLLHWGKPKADQLELLDADPAQPCEPGRDARQPPAQQPTPTRSSKAAADKDVASAGRALLVPLDRLAEDPSNPRMAESIREHGILQPLVVSPADATGRHRIHHGPSAVARRDVLA